MPDQIYIVRKNLGGMRQGKFNKDINTLHNLIASVGATEPYFLNKLGRDLLMGHPAYYQGSKGQIVKKRPRNYIYRVCPIAQLQSRIVNWNYVNVKSKDDSKVLVALSLAQGGDKSNWVPLDFFSKDKRFDSKRSFTWWTDENLERKIKQIGGKSTLSMVTLFKLGLVEDYIDELSVMMRIKAKEISTDSLKVPTVIDAYDSVVFSPQQYPNKIEAGETIDLQNPPSFVGGFKEYALKSELTSLIELTPVIVKKPRLSNTVAQSTSFTTEFFELLNEYYSNQA